MESGTQPNRRSCVISTVISVISVSVLIGLTIFTSLPNTLPTTMRPFDLKDRNIRHPEEQYKVDSAYLYLTCSIIIFVFIIVWFGLEGRLHNLSIIKKNVLGILSMMFFIIVGACFMIILVNAMKRFAGHLRPYFLTACAPNVTMEDELYSQNTSWVDINMTTTICTNNKSLEYRWSFPSGHSAGAWYAAMMSIFILQNIKVKYSEDLYIFLLPLKPSFQFLLFAGASWISIKETVDNQHFWWDVVAGGLLGSLIATVMFYWHMEPVMESTENPIGDEVIEPSQTETHFSLKWKTVLYISTGLAWFGLAKLAIWGRHDIFPTTMRPFDLNDRSISYYPENRLYTVLASLDESLNSQLPIFLCDCVVSVVIMVWFGLEGKLAIKNYGRILYTCLFYLLGACFLFLMVGSMQCLVGQLRPNFLFKCQPNQTVVADPQDSWVDVETTKIVCTTKMKLYRWSFPSLSSARVWYTVMMSICTIRNITVENNHKLMSSFIKAIVEFALFATASYSCIVDTLDTYNFWWDVVAGSLLGSLFATVMFYWYMKPVMESTEKSCCLLCCLPSSRRMRVIQRRYGLKKCGCNNGVPISAEEEPLTAAPAEVENNNNEDSPV